MKTRPDDRQAEFAEHYKKMISHEENFPLLVNLLLAEEDATNLSRLVELYKQLMRNDENLDIYQKESELLIEEVSAERAEEG